MTEPAAPADLAPLGPEWSLADLVDHLLHRGVVVNGNVTISVAEIDLIYLDLRLLFAAVERLTGPAPTEAGGSPAPVGSSSGHRTARPRAARPTATTPRGDHGRAAEEVPQARATLPERVDLAPERIEQGLARLVLSVVELIREVLERQAVRRMEGGSLTPEEVERLGLALLRLDQKMAELRAAFGLERDDVVLRLGAVEGELMKEAGG